MKKLLFTFCLLLSCSVAFGQISTEEEPVSFRTTNIPALRTSDRAVKFMSSLDMERIQAEERRRIQRHTSPFWLPAGGELQFE
jgi:hypothetical protein